MCLAFHSSLDYVTIFFTLLLSKSVEAAEYSALENDVVSFGTTVGPAKRSGQTYWHRDQPQVLWIANHSTAACSLTLTFQSLRLTSC
jgi:hypothetical protein